MNSWGVNELADRVHGAPESDINALVHEYIEAYDVAPELLPGAQRHQSLRDGAAIEIGLRAFLEEGGFSALPRPSRTSGSRPQLPALAVCR